MVFDEEEMIHLVKMLVKNAGGRDKYPDERMEQLVIDEDESPDGEFEENPDGARLGLVIEY
jgi:20S proteasome alpha/beta subunit